MAQPGRFPPQTRSGRLPPNRQNDFPTLLSYFVLLVCVLTVLSEFAYLPCICFLGLLPSFGFQIPWVGITYKGSHSGLRSPSNGPPKLRSVFSLWVPQPGRFPPDPIRKVPQRPPDVLSYVPFRNLVCFTVLSYVVFLYTLLSSFVHLVAVIV